MSLKDGPSFIKITLFAFLILPLVHLVPLAFDKTYSLTGGFLYLIYWELLLALFLLALASPALILVVVCKVLGKDIDEFNNAPERLLSFLSFLWLIIIILGCLIMPHKWEIYGIPIDNSSVLEWINSNFY